MNPEEKSLLWFLVFVFCMSVWLFSIHYLSGLLSRYFPDGSIP